MSTERWNLIENLFHSALELDPAKRTTFVQEQCNDPVIVKEVLSLLEAHNRVGSFIDTAVIANLGEYYEQENLPAGEIIGAYKIQKVIGHGGMGSVYLAVRADRAFEKHVAIKLLKRGMDTDEILRHFHNERQILANFDHPNIARLLDGGSTSNGLPYFVMEYVDGLPIDRYCDHHRLGILQRLHLFRDVCSAVSYAHRHLVVHRDLKPSNILVTPEGVPKLLDFGIAKILSEGQEKSTATGVRLMTPDYASPEQALGAPVTTASDVYTLGILLYELLTGGYPYQLENRSPMEIARVICDSQPLLPSSSMNDSSLEVSHGRNSSPEQLRRTLRGDLDNIIQMALRKEPERRYPSVEQFAEDIRRHLVGLPVVARKDTIAYRLTKFTKRNKVGVAAAILVLFTLIGGVVATTWQAQKAKGEQLRAEYARQFGDDLRYVQSLMLSTYLAPLHDTRPNSKRARIHLETMERQMIQGGKWAYGAGKHALGNGYLILKDYEKAKTYLESAWDSGYHEPSTAYALGKVLGNLYLQSVTNADRLGNNELKQKMLHEAEDQYAGRAIEFLSQARTYAESPAYVEGLIALYQKRFDQALVKTKEALQSSSRPDEVLKLQGDIYFAMAREADNTSNQAKAYRSYSLAGDSYEAASDRARSDPDPYLANAGRYVRMIAGAGKPLPNELQKALILCDKALQTNPDSDQPHLMKGELYVQDGIQKMYHSSEDPEPSFVKVVESAENATKIKSTAASHELASRGYLRMAEHKSAISADPREMLHQAIAESQRALQIEPYYADASISEASAQFYMGEYQQQHGEDPTGSYKRIIDLFDHELKGIPKDLFSYNLLALTNLGIAEYEMKRGRSPEKHIQKTLECYADALKLNANAANLYDGIGLTYVDLAKYQMDRGIDPQPSFQEAIKNYDRGLQIDNNDYGIFNRGIAYLTRAEHKVRRGESAKADLENAMQNFQKAFENELPPAELQIAAVHLLSARQTKSRAELNQARKFAGKYLQENPSVPEAQLISGMIESISGQWAGKDRSPEADSYFNRAAEHIQMAITLNPQDVKSFIELSTVYRWRSELMNTDKWIDPGIQATYDGEKIYPQHPELLAIRSDLLQLKNRSLPQKREEPKKR